MSGFKFSDFDTARRRIDRWLTSGADFGPAGEDLFTERYTGILIGCFHGGDTATLESLAEQIDASTTDADVAAALADVGLLDGGE